MLAMGCLTGHVLAVRLLGEKFPSSFITPAFYSVAFAMLLLLFWWEKPRLDWTQISQTGVLLPLVIAGVTIGLTDFFFVKSLNLGADASVAMPILVGGSAVFIALFAALLFGEALTLAKIFGIALTISGLFMIYRG